MLNAIPVLGWLISAGISVSLSIPFWICWTVCGLGAKYFYWLPETYRVIPFWHAVGLFIVISILKSALTPNFCSFTQNAGNKERKQNQDKG